MDAADRRACGVGGPLNASPGFAIVNSCTTMETGAVNEGKLLGESKDALVEEKRFAAARALQPWKNKHTLDEQRNQ